MERFSFIFLVAGLGFFVLAFVISAWLPWLPFADMDIATVKELAANPPLEFVELREQYPQAFDKAFGDKSDPDAFAEALVAGRKIYVGEGCWHCHSQQVRPVGGDEARFGRVSYPEEYNNAMNFPPIWGTRRIGPDLVRENGRHSNDWHVAHFWNPPDVSPTSVMPRYPWFYERDDPATPIDESLQPNKKGLEIIAYVQWLGSWQTNTRENLFGVESIERQYKAPPAPNAPTGAAPPAPGAQPKPPPAEDPFGAGGTNGANEGTNGGAKPEPDPFGN